MSTQNQSPLKQPPSPNPLSIHSDISQEHSAHFSASPPPSQQPWNSPNSHSQTHLHLEQDEQSAVPLLHHKTGFPITVFIDPSMLSPPTSLPFLDNQLDSHPHPHLIPITQSSYTEHHHQQSPSSIVQNAPLPELPLHLLPKAEDEFDTERLEQVVERLRDGNNRMSTEALQYAENSNARADGMCIGGARRHAHNVVTNGVLFPADQGGAGPPVMVPREETVNQEQNHQNRIGGGENARRSMEGANTQKCSGDIVSSQNPTNENHLPQETLKEEPVLLQGEGAHRHEQTGLTEQENGMGVNQEIIAQNSGVEDDDGSPYDPSPAQDQSDQSPGTSDRVQPRRTGRKRRRGDLETGYWLRSRNPPSSSKRSRRTDYWLRP